MNKFIKLYIAHYLYVNYNIRIAYASQFQRIKRFSYYRENVNIRHIGVVIQ